MKTMEQATATRPFEAIDTCSPNALSLRPHGLPGTLITLCGIDGAGKTSTINAVADYIGSQGLPVFCTYTPTERVRTNSLFRTLVDAADSKARSQIDILGLCLTILGDLIQHISDTIIPHLEQGHVVICDRYIYTSQAEVHSRAADEIPKTVLAYIAKHVIRPDLAIGIHIDPDTARARIRQREHERDKPLDLEFMKIQADAYLNVARDNGLLMITTDAPLESTFAMLKPSLDYCLAKYKK
jgi:dTMP kinase